MGLVDDVVSLAPEESEAEKLGVWVLEDESLLDVDDCLVLDDEDVEVWMTRAVGLEVVVAEVDVLMVLVVVDERLRVELLEDEVEEVGVAVLEVLLVEETWDVVVDCVLDELVLDEETMVEEVDRVDEVIAEDDVLDDIIEV